MATPNRMILSRNPIDWLCGPGGTGSSHLASPLYDRAPAPAIWSTMNGSDDTPLDLFVVGGGINGAGIACDAVGRSLKVGLCEMNDFASATSSASTKLIHGGL